MTFPQDPHESPAPQGRPPSGSSMPPPDPSVLQSLIRPRPVQVAFVLWMIYVGISLVVLVLGAVMVNDATRSVGVEGSLAAEQMRGAAVVTLVLTLILIVATGLVALPMRNGANWARIVLTVLAALVIIGTLLSLPGLDQRAEAGGLGVAHGTLSMLSVLPVVAALVSMYRSESNSFFRS
ncbi:hypothetical protein H0B56_01950 [Haloechinothrix sp. YIM 98757]|uniref:Uncharacterized protein n=1 Tax=Haloechinothrix aidingensis TaxID=2752311 RepID=A0A838A7M3_9PSEU|nr:hypothetical protein [Haloechinothrix aidingensis]MBA0124299.1 hypothetical protein [Haloechinothrix aidingensis]